MAIINEYKGSYPSKVNTFETDSFYVNASSMEKAVSMLTLEHGEEPTICTKIRDNVLTEITDETTVNIEVKSYYIDEDTQEEIEIPPCIVYPNIIENAKRGNTIYFTAPTYNLDEESGFLGEWNLDKWIYNTTESTDNPFIFTVPLDESITSILIKAIYTKN